METIIESNRQELAVKRARPIVFDYVNFRSFLFDSFLFLQGKNPRLSESAFIQRAGYGANSRGYLKLIRSGKRNISHKAIAGFSTSLKMTDKETGYFENLVHFNQSNNDEEKSYYFERMQKFIKGKESEAYGLLRSQYHYLSQWYLVAIRELVSLKDFVEDTTWITKKLRKEVNKAQVLSAIDDLLNLGLLKRNEVTEKLEQSDAVVKFNDDFQNFNAVTSIHKQLLEKAAHRIDEDDYQDRSASAINFTCKRDDFTKIREEIAAFRKSILEKYGQQKEDMDHLLSMSIQLIHLTDTKTL